MEVQAWGRAGHKTQKTLEPCMFEISMCFDCACRRKTKGCSMKVQALGLAGHKTQKHWSPACSRFLCVCTALVDVRPEVAA